MILSNLSGSIIEEQEEMGVQLNEEEMPSDDSPEFASLKKYYLSEKLHNLKARLSTHGISNDDLDLILKFNNELSYDTLLKLTDAIVDIIKVQLAQEVKSYEESKRKRKKENV